MISTNNKPSKPQLQKFVAENFATVEELEVVKTAPDWKKSPSILNKIRDPKYRKWTSELNNLWPTFLRRAKKDVNLNPAKYSFIYVPNPFVIPGGRFKGKSN